MISMIPIVPVAFSRSSCGTLAIIIIAAAIRIMAADIAKMPRPAFAEFAPENWLAHRRTANMPKTTKNAVRLSSALLMSKLEIISMALTKITRPITIARTDAADPHERV